MKTLRMLSIVAALLLLVGIVQAQETDPAIAKAKVVLAGKLKDSDSARFADVVHVADNNFVCGWVNAKNSFGGYVGFKPFLVSGSFAEIREDNSAGVFNNRGTFAMLWDKCVPYSGEKFGDVTLDLPKINTPRYCKKLRKTLGEASTTGQSCERDEAASLAWLQDHTTASWIAMRCAQRARETHSYGLTQSCVREEESDIVFGRGPRVGNAEAAAMNYGYDGKYHAQ